MHIGAHRLLVQASSDVPAAFDVTELCSVCTLELCPLDEEKFRALFGQYSRFDISSQQPKFYCDVYHFLGSWCTALVMDYQQGDADVLFLMSSDPTLVFGGSEDRLDCLVVAMLLTCLVLTRRQLLAGECGSIMLIQYSE